MLWPTVWTINSSHRVWAHVFIESAANTLRLIYFRDRAVSTTTFTTSRPLWMHLKFTTTEIGQLTSPLFSQEREVSANPFCVSCSQTHSNVEKSRQDVDPFSSVEKARLGVEPFSRFEKLLSKGKEIENCRVSKILKWKGNEFCPNKDIHDFLEKKADHAFMETLQLSQDYRKRNLIWTEQIGKCDMLILLFVKLGCSFNLEDGICIRHIHCLINLKGKRAGYVKN